VKRLVLYKRKVVTQLVSRVPQFAPNRLSFRLLVIPLFITGLIGWCGAITTSIAIAAPLRPKRCTFRNSAGRSFIWTKSSPIPLGWQPSPETRNGKNGTAAPSHNWIRPSKKYCGLVNHCPALKQSQLFEWFRDWMTEGLFQAVESGDAKAIAAS